MKSRKNIYSGLIIGYTLLSVSFSPYTFAQTKIKEDGRDSPVAVKVRNEMEWMQEALDLSMEQYDKINIIAYTYARKCDSLDHIQNVHSRQVEKDKCAKRKDTDIKAILNATQYRTYLSDNGKKHMVRSPFASTY